jgi:hypothetical protein
MIGTFSHPILELVRGWEDTSQDDSSWQIRWQDRGLKELVNPCIVKRADGNLLAKCRSDNLSHLVSNKDE